MGTVETFWTIPTDTRARQRHAAFTIAEVLVAAAIGTFILGGVLTTYIMTSKQFRAIANYWEIHTGGRAAIDRFAADMRGVSAITSFNTNGPLVVVIPTNFSVTGQPTTTKTVTYTYTNGELRRTDSVTGKTAVLARDIYSLHFRLYDRLGNPTSVLANAKAVQVELFLRKYVTGQAQTEDYLSARLDMRNKP